MYNFEHEEVLHSEPEKALHRSPVSAKCLRAEVTHLKFPGFKINC